MSNLNPEEVINLQIQLLLCNHFERFLLAPIFMLS